MGTKQTVRPFKLHSAAAVVAATAALILGLMALPVAAQDVSGPATVMVATNGEWGDILVDAAGMTLYNFTNDEGAGGSTCYDKCAEAWPPLLTDGDPVAGAGAEAGLLGVVERTDGTLQVTYNGWPLYYYFTDEAPGDTTGQGKGDVWYLLSPAGEMIVAMPAEQASAAAGAAETAAAATQQQMFQTAVASYLADTAGFGALSERLNGGDEIQPGDLAAVHGIGRIVMAADWPADLQESAAALAGSLDELAQALAAQDPAAAAPLATDVSTLAADLSAAVDQLLGADEAMSSATEDAAPATLMLAGNDLLGDILVDAAGMTLYNFTNDEGAGGSTCYDKCAEAWPPLLVDGQPVAGDGIDPALLGAVERTDGTMQVTYNGWPLYYYFTDAAPGDVTGQGKGDVWYVLSAAGEMITTAVGQ